MQRLRRIADQHCTRRDQFLRHTAGDRIGAALPAGQEASGAPAEGRLHAREECGLVQCGHCFGFIAGNTMYQSEISITTRQ